MVTEGCPGTQTTNHWLIASTAYCTPSCCVLVWKLALASWAQTRENHQYCLCIVFIQDMLWQTWLYWKGSCNGFPRLKLQHKIAFFVMTSRKIHKWRHIISLSLVPEKRCFTEMEVKQRHFACTVVRKRKQFLITNSFYVSLLWAPFFELRSFSSHGQTVPLISTGWNI